LTRSLAVESSTGVIGQLLRTVDAASRRTRGDRRQAARYSDVDAPRQSGSCQASLDAYNWRDVDAWFAELDRFADVPFMDEGRRQPPLPADEDLFA